jgi:L-lactate utilization protein LutB
VELNRVLEEMGVEVVESDLGEYIVQLAEEAPSHIIIPTIHKSRKQVAELFSREAGEPLPKETRALTRFARQRMRQKFLQADIGGICHIDRAAFPLFRSDQGRIPRSLPFGDEEGRIRQELGPLATWTQTRDFPAPARRSFRDWWKQERRNKDD